MGSHKRQGIFLVILSSRLEAHQHIEQHLTVITKMQLSSTVMSHSPTKPWWRWKVRNVLAYHSSITRLQYHLRSRAQLLNHPLIWPNHQLLRLKTVGAIVKGSLQVNNDVLLQTSSIKSKWNRCKSKPGSPKDTSLIKSGGTSGVTSSISTQKYHWTIHVMWTYSQSSH